MGLARPAMARLPQVGFWKLCGSGVGEGFTPLPNTAVYAILATWPDRAAAEAGLSAPVFQRYRAHARESWTLLLEASAARGRWSGRTPFVAGAESGQPVAALTRASIRPSKLIKFWRRGPAISLRVGADPNVLFKIGIGEIPLLHQVTFSIWPDTETMADFARRGGPHADAIRAVREGNWFSEELYARFRIADSRGSWGGRDPLALHQRHPEPA